MQVRQLLAEVHIGKTGANRTTPIRLELEDVGSENTRLTGSFGQFGAFHRALPRHLSRSRLPGGGSCTSEITTPFDGL